MSAEYERLTAAVAGEPLPLALVDLDAVDANVARLRAPVAAAHKTLRVATKSLRCPALVEHVLTQLGDEAGGLLIYAAAEARFWAERGIRDLLVAYPTVQPSDVAHVEHIVQSGGSVRLAVDAVAQLDVWSALGQKIGRRVQVVLDLDMSYRPLGGVHLGVRRSPLHTVDEVVTVARAALGRPGVELVGLLAYEAQVAGLADRERGKRLARWPERAMKRFSLRELVARRAAIVAAVRALGIELALINGGGSGSIDASSADPSLTEVAAGSGFVDSHLFDGYDGLALRPAIYFALQVTRHPKPGIVTCLGGGFIASGGAGPDRLPLPALPPGGRLLPLEGAGEVQTPVELHGAAPPLGAPIFFRHAKAGELAEHFTHYLFVRDRTIVARAPTYRGLGHCFLG